MTAVLAPYLFDQFLNQSGTAVALGYKLFTYKAGTSTKQFTYTDSTQSVQNANPIILDSVGNAGTGIWLDPTLVYKFVFAPPNDTDPPASAIWTRDNIYPEFNSSTPPSVIGAILYPQTAAEAAAGVVPVNFAYEEGWVQRYGWVDDNVTDNGSLVATLTTLAQSGIVIRWNAFNTGIFKTSVPFLFTSPVRMIGAPGIRIKLTATAAYVMKWDASGGGASFSHGGLLEDFILDGGGFAADGLYLRNIVSANFYRIRSTNLSGWGIHLAWAQLCYFDTPTCSNNVEAFGVVPAGGCLIDNANGGGSSSANVFVNPCWEQMQTSAGAGVGCKAQWAINNIWLNGTSEGNKIGMIIGDLVAGTGIGNSLIGMDMESNVTADLQILGIGGIGYNNDVIGGKCTSTNAVFVTGGASNHFLGGFNGGITFDVNSNHNTIKDLGLFGAGAVITDAGTQNSWSGIYNSSTAAVTTDFPVRRRTNFVLAATGSVTPDISVTSLATVTFNGAGASTITFNSPTNPRDSLDLEICFHAAGAGAVTFAWAAAVGGYKVPAALSGVQANPANGFNRTYRFRYDPNNGFWYFASQTATDVPN